MNAVFGVNAVRRQAGRARLKIRLFRRGPLMCEQFVCEVCDLLKSRRFSEKEFVEKFLPRAVWTSVENKYFQRTEIQINLY